MPREKLLEFGKASGLKIDPEVLRSAPLVATKESSLETARAMAAIYKDAAMFPQARSHTELPTWRAAGAGGVSGASSSSAGSSQIAEAKSSYTEFAQVDRRPPGRPRSKAKLNSGTGPVWVQNVEAKSVGDDAPIESPSADQFQEVPWQGFPEDPDEPSMIVEGADIDECGNLEVVSYMKFKDYFANEPPRMSHPVRDNPGTKEDEQEQLTGLKWWSDARGEGWIAKYNKEAKWFSAIKLGSWRLAFMLARLQRDVWFKDVDVEPAGAQRSAKKPQHGRGRVTDKEEPAQAADPIDEYTIDASAEAVEESRDEAETKVADVLTKASLTDVGPGLEDLCRGRRTPQFRGASANGKSTGLKRYPAVQVSPTRLRRKTSVT
jgi:hypothetical protein